jgi:hypothetical protein
MPWWIRAYLVFAAVQGFGIGLTGLFAPAEMQIPLRITPLNARFVAALYIAGGVGVAWAVFSRRRAEARLFVIGFALATGLIMGLTALHWSEFLGDGLPHRPVWLFDYLVDPAVGVIIIAITGFWGLGVGARHRLSVLFLIQAIVFGAVGLALLVAPDALAAAWPWALPPLLGQLYACFFLTFGVCAFIATRETEPRAIRGFVLSSLALVLLVLVASILHLDRFKAEPVTWLWFAAFILAACAFAGALLVYRAGLPVAHTKVAA